MSPVTQARGGKGGDKIEIETSWKVAGGFLTLTTLSLLTKNLVAAVPLGALSFILARQTPRVKFVFDDEAMEVFIKDKEGGSYGSRENFAVGGRNRWNYKNWIDWKFLPSRQVPILVAFWENQTPGSDPSKGQFHLFPCMANSEQLYLTMENKIGKKKSS